MSYYLVKFQPLEPYFFGNEKSSNYDTEKTKTQKSGSYFTRSEEKPSQSSILGVLRFMFLECTKNDFNYSKDERALNNEAVGAASFNMEIKVGQNFGKIKSLSPLFIVKEDEYFVKLPFDHQVKDGNRVLNQRYKPFAYEEIPVNTTVKEKILPVDFNAKDGIANAYVSLDNGYLDDNIFGTVVKTGIKTGADQDSFFKKEYKYLNEGYAFACIAEIDPEKDEFKKDIVYMGQGKSAFSVSLKKVNDKNILENKIQVLLKKYHQSQRIAYAASDCLVDGDFYEICQFASTKMKEYRSFTTDPKSENHFDRFTRENVLYTLIEAGSVFIVADEKKFLEKFENENCQKIGYNKIIFGGKE